MSDEGVEDLEEGILPLLSNPLSTHVQNTSWRRHGSFFRFLDGPHPRLPPKPSTPLFRTQNRLNNVLSESKSTRKVTIFWLIFYAIWFLAFGALVRQTSFALDNDVLFLSCTSTLWDRKNGCSLDGLDCEPFEGTSIEFRCPGACLSEVVLNPRYIGDLEVFHQPLVIGGQGKTDNSSGVYRADSFICASAIHAGIATDKSGGCGTLETRGLQDHFEASESHGISSFPFPSEFPKSFSFSKLVRDGCTDLRWEITTMNVLFSVFYALLQSSSQTFYWVLFIMVFLHLALVSDPPPTTSYELVSIACEGLLPSLFVGYTFWRVAVRWTLKSALPLDRIIWLGGLWFGALLEYITVHIPISRLLLSDIMRDGGLFWLIGLIVLLLFIIVEQMRIMRKAGDLIYYLKIYLGGLAVLVVASQLPGLSLRIHHYIFGMLFIAGTAYPTKLSLLYSGILVGLFLDGIARWGFDSILETPGSLRGDASMESIIPKLIQTDNWLDDGYIAWTGEPPANYYYSVLINEVERYRGPLTRLYPKSLTPAIGLLPDVPYFLRVAYTFGKHALDYTDPATFYANGTVHLPSQITSVT